MSVDTSLRLVVTSRRMLTADVCEFELRRPDGLPLPAAEPGAHINVDTPSGQIRSYSLTADVRDDSRYVIAVRRDRLGRGGSMSMVDGVVEGNVLGVSAPHNAFALEDAAGYLLVAAGIGITPIRAMLVELSRRGARGVQLVYLSRSAAETPYLDEVVKEAGASGRAEGSAGDPTHPVTLHHRRLHGALDWWPLLEHPGERRLYVCGPDELQNELRALTMHWRPSRVHMENFAGVSAFGEISLPFTAVWSPTGAEFEVAAGRTMLSALLEAGAEVPSSCESGTCGTCRVRVVSGEAQHRDVVLTPDEQYDFMMPCVSRALGERIEVAPL
ncbi:PDR/VanB family oxidoreductase [Agreia sp. COWG]|uniref:PDR/VanB family oxidoreductase n=1 Tax=Agreia sp. COWG TaxID=2773266 RepID=UPI0019259E4A|nr:PDR/VanB family oxidoreductase [Agreia sp. COWG]CAD6011480.1 Phthalate dioxygenase reductase [Agreia sp. COWG]